MSDLKLKLIEHKKMTGALEKARDLFESITCFRAENVDVFTSHEILNGIASEALIGYKLCKAALEPTE